MDDKPTLTPRLHPRRIYSEALVALSRLGEFVMQSGLDHRLIDLIDIRASQLNRCGYCLDMHTKDARLAGETEERIYLLDAWREAP
jgi:AhpD family alkylhydroperoxidase